MTIPIASDHAGFEAKEKIKKMLEELDHIPADFGTHSGESVDYPDFAIQVAEKVNEGEYDRGLLVCGSGQGMCMTANKYANIRAALAYDESSARLSRQHNNANILCLPGRSLENEQLKIIIKTWLDTHFEGGRHERRVNKIKNLTNNN